MDKNTLLDQASVNKISNIALKAGAAILEVYGRDFKTFEKSDESPLTEADLAAHKIIVDELSLHTPGIPILSEESADIDWNTRKQWDTYWLVDPLDGTKEFIKRNGEFTVNIALISDGIPVLGVVFAPVLDLLYYASQDIGAWKKESGIDAERIKVSNASADGELKVMGSRSHQSEEFKQYIQQFKSVEIVSMGSSLKLCYVAEGKADLYPRLGLTSEWDTGAAHAVVKYAGGECINYETNSELKYNTKDSLLNPFFIVKGF